MVVEQAQAAYGLTTPQRRRSIYGYTSVAVKTIAARDTRLTDTAPRATIGAIEQFIVFGAG
ncbi:hypothetical protein BH23CHL9_BH23CHL9_08890 [soil metagenome]